MHIKSAQQRMSALCHAVWGDACATSVLERSQRFLEEAVELVQTAGMSREQAHTMIDYVFGRPTEKDVSKELGGAAVTLLVLSEALDVDLETAVLRDFRRIEANATAMREKHLLKPAEIRSV
jgi:NTP pyrophosphatase (non-canonical NTP hydrolase)